jgi:hypothetical protein
MDVVDWFLRQQRVHELGGAMATMSSSLGFSARMGGGMRPRRSIYSGTALLASNSTSPSHPMDSTWPPHIEHGLPAVGVDGALKFQISVQWTTDGQSWAPCSS